MVAPYPTPVPGWSNPSLDAAFEAAQPEIMRGVTKGVRDMIARGYEPHVAQAERRAAQVRADYQVMSEKDLAREIKRLEKEMLQAARNLEFERAAQLRDELRNAKERLFIGPEV